MSEADQPTTDPADAPVEDAPAVSDPAPTDPGPAPEAEAPPEVTRPWHGVVNPFEGLYQWAKAEIARLEGKASAPTDQTG